MGCGDDVATGGVPFTPRAKKVLELSKREALSMGNNYIGTERLLLGLVREGTVWRRAFFLTQVWSLTRLGMW